MAYKLEVAICDFKFGTEWALESVTYTWHDSCSKQAMNTNPNEVAGIDSKIYLIRGQKVMLDFDLAELYLVPTMRLNEQVKRNARRFPPDFAFSLSDQEFKILKSQFAISSSTWGGRRTPPLESGRS